MIKLLGKISLVAALALLSPATAVEFNNNAQEQVVYQDTGTEAINSVQDEPAPQYQPKDAEEQAQDWLDKTPFSLGWNDDKKVFVSIGTAFFDSENPSYDDSFIIKRSLKSMEASLNAKSEIIEFTRVEMNAMDKAVTPGTDLNAQFKDEMDKLQNKMEAQKNKLAKLLADVDAKEAEALKGATFGDRMNSLLDATIKKLDDKYSSEEIAAKKREKFEKAKNRYLEAQKEYAEVEKKLKATTGTIKEELGSKVATMASMPLFGAITMAQFESWDEDSEQYKVSLVVVWSAKSEKSARAFISGEDFKVKPGNKNLKEWIKSNDWSTSTGGRKFVDDRGVTHFIGIAASPVGKSSSSEKKARGVSELMAKKEVAMSLFSDVSASKQAEQMMQTRSGGADKDSSAAAESFASTLQQSIEKRQIQGLQKLYGKKVSHPISGQKIYVTIYGISGEAAKAAMIMEERNYLTKILDVKSQKASKGVKDGYNSAVNKTEKDNSPYNESKASTESKTLSSANKQVNNQKIEVIKNNSTSQKDSAEERKSQSGSFSGGGNTKSYDW